MEATERERNPPSLVDRRTKGKEGSCGSGWVGRGAVPVRGRLSGRERRLILTPEKEKKKKNYPLVKTIKFH